jgi:hypothetical protein
VRRMIVSAVCALALLSAGCSEHRPARPSGPTPAPAAEGCEGRTPFFASSPAYGGKGPHKLVAQWFGDYDSARVARPESLTVPEEWIASNIGRFPFILLTEPSVADWQQAQLALCVGGPVAHFDRPGGKCGPYQPGGDKGYYHNTVDATYAFRVFEVRTGRLVKEFTLEGTDEDCPHDLFLRAPALARVPSDKALAAQLRPLVEKPVG